jgi:RNA polymerase sigma factor (sigma-70 family)
MTRGLTDVTRRTVVGVDGRTTTDLVVAARVGDAGAGDALVDRFVHLVYAVTRSFPLPPHERDDVCQCVFARFFEHLDRIRDPERAGSWLATTTRNECLRILRSARRVVVADDLDDVTDDRPPVDDHLLAGERHAELLEAFGRIPAHCQELLALLFGERCSYAETAARLTASRGTDVSLGYIGPTRQRCLEHLRRELAFDDASLTSTGGDGHD